MSLDWIFQRLKSSKMELASFRIIDRNASEEETSLCGRNSKGGGRVKTLWV